MSTHARSFLFPMMIVLLMGGCATKSSNPPTSSSQTTLTDEDIKAIEADGEVEAQAQKLYCYIHHNCPYDGIMEDRNGSRLTMTKRQCSKQRYGYSWGNAPNGAGGVCENLK